VSALGLIVLNRKRLKRRVFIALLTNPIPTLVAGMIQVRFYGLVLIWPVATLYLIVSFSNIENRRSKTDYLTGTANRRSLDEELERRIEFSKSGRTLCGLLLDIDDFKVINDRFGHEAGDRALEDVANILLASVRVNDHVARMGGDEFVVLFDLMEPSAMEDLVHRIETAIENLNASKQRPYRISSSIGRSIYRQEDGGSASDFLSILDADMYARKKNR
jgi:diguanylate cyclase (GGDEF)-like protein